MNNKYSKIIRSKKNWKYPATLFGTTKRTEKQEFSKTSCMFDEYAVFVGETPCSHSFPTTHILFLLVSHRARSVADRTAQPVKPDTQVTSVASGHAKQSFPVFQTCKGITPKTVPKPVVKSSAPEPAKPVAANKRRKIIYESD
jgi:hypothetical protein